MKILFTSLSVLTLSIFSLGQTAMQPIAIIPEPVSIIKNDGQFLLPQNIEVEAAANPELEQIIAVLKNKF